jgi:xanthine/uracil permease
MRFKYNLEDRPPFIELLFFALQWFVIAVPTIVIIGKISADFHFNNPANEIVYFQKLTFVMGISIFTQVIAGHRMPIIIGPSTVLLIGIIASHNTGPETIYSSILLGGCMLFLLSISKFFEHLVRFFTPRVISVVLLLIAFTLMPTITNLILPKQSIADPLGNIIFASALTGSMFVLYKRLKGFGRSTLIIWSIVGGSMLNFIFFPAQTSPEILDNVPVLSGFFHNVITGISIDPGVLIAFFLCFMALSVNDLGSIQAMNEILQTPDPNQRITRGILITGLANILSGFLGVIGPVNYSLSPGVIASTGCASRWALLPVSILLCFISFSPAILGFISHVPSLIIGCILFFILSFQVAAGLALFLKSNKGDLWEGGLIIGLSIMIGTAIAFLPDHALNAIPAMLRPIVGNGFVMGVFTALVLEHLIFRNLHTTH